ncbi:MAG: TolC family protein, partial [Salegentibacter mishustinae]|nr:TolC family protein [Salegentibacter mishustinae]
NDESNRANDQALDVLGVRQFFNFPTVYFARKKVYKTGFKQEQSTFMLKQLNLEQKVSRVYYQLQYEKARIAVYEDLDSLYQKFAYAAKRRFELGETNYLEKITARSKQKQLETQLKQAQNELSISYEKLKPLINTDQEIIIKKVPIEKLSIKSLGVQGNPGLEFYQNRNDFFQARAALEKQNLLPDISLSYFQFNNDVIDTPLKGYQVGVHIPLLFFGNSSKIKAANIARKAAEQETADYEIRLNSEYKQLLQQLNKHQQALSYYENEGKELSEEIIKTANLSYKNGEIDFFEYIQSLENSYNIILSYYENLNAYNQTVLQINHLTL